MISPTKHCFKSFIKHDKSLIAITIILIIGAIILFALAPWNPSPDEQTKFAGMITGGFFIGLFGILCVAVIANNYNNCMKQVKEYNLRHPDQ